MTRMTRYTTQYERLVANTRVDADGCWIWTGATGSNGYPRFTERRPGCPHPVKTAAHRRMLEITTGWLFPFDEAGHYRCFKPLCIRPDCLEIQTPAENLSDRRGYKACEGRMIPVLFPTPGRILEALVDRVWESAGELGQECPF
jgi:hypothetical protein